MTVPSGANSAGQAPHLPASQASVAAIGWEEAQQVLHRRLVQLVGDVVLSPAAVDRLARRGVARSYRAGETVVHKGVRGDFMGVVVDGQVAVTSPPEAPPGRTAGRDSPTVLLLPGSTFGEAMLLKGRPSGSTLRALVDSQLLILNRGTYLAVARRRDARPALQPREWLPWLGLLALLALAVFSVGLGLSLDQDLVAGLVGTGSQARPASSPVQVHDALRIVAPRDGEVVIRAGSLPVHAVLAEPGFFEAELQVDGLGQGVQVNSSPEAVPWQVEWDWEAAAVGAHRLAVQARRAEGEWWISAPLTVTVVPSGTLAVASNRDGPLAIYTMDTAGDHVQRLGTGPGEARQPAWNPNGTLAFVAETEPGRMSIRTMDVGRSPVDIVAGLDPAWSPDGTHLAYAAGVDNISQVFVLPVPGGAPQQVTTEETYGGQPAWSPDGRSLAYVAERDGNWDIWVVPLGGGAPRQLTQGAAMDWAPAWSPDGTRLAFVSNRSGIHQIYTMRPDGADARALTNLPEGAEAPAWSPDGYWLAYVAYTGESEGVNAREIYLMRADGRDPVRVTYNTFDDTQPDWGPGFRAQP